jgi:sulfofructose kinase
MKPRIICVGHAALDRVYRIQAIPTEPQKVRALEHIESGGGMAANAAVAISRLGGRAELWSRVGDDAVGAQIRAGLQANRVDIRNVQTFDGARSSTSAIIVDAAGERLIIGDRDAGMPSGTSWLPLEWIADADVVLGDLRWLEAVRVAFERARREGVTTILDAELGAREALADLLPLCDYAIFSHSALVDLVPAIDLMAKLDAVLAMGAGHAGVTLGSEGYRWAEQGGDRGFQPAFPVDVVDTTGAGDAFHGAFALACAEGQSTAEAVRLAAAVAALKCRRLGSRAGLPTRDEVEALIATGIVIGRSG